MPWRTLKLFRTTERDAAKRAAERLSAEQQAPVRVVPCHGRGLRVVVGDDERVADVPVARDRRRK